MEGFCLNKSEIRRKPSLAIPLRLYIYRNKQASQGSNMTKTGKIIAMGKPRPLCRKKNGTVKLKFVVEKLQKSFSSLSRKPSTSDLDEVEALIGDSSSVPEDVKEGHFAVFAKDDHGEPKRFVVALSYLTHPAFIRLLEQAAEEFGFDQEGALTIPCRSTELERILAEHWEMREVNANVHWMSCKTMVKSY